MDVKTAVAFKTGDPLSISRSTKSLLRAMIFGIAERASIRNDAAFRSAAVSSGLITAVENISNINRLWHV